jgi:murein DD-endopeptidase MepM/ murein hydrolase activator NlpD
MRDRGGTICTDLPGRDMAERLGSVHAEIRGPDTIGVGRRFLPLPRAQLLRGPGDQRVAVLPAAAGTPVHAIAAGSVVDVDGAGGVALSGEDGSGQHYAGLDAAGVTIHVQARVPAGAIVGVVGAQGRLEVRLSDPSGQPVDAVEALIGLPDPSELGLPSVVTDLVDTVGPDDVVGSVDPDDLDRELAPADPWERS